MYDMGTAAIERNGSWKNKGCGFSELLKMVDDAAREVFAGRRR